MVIAFLFLNQGGDAQTPEMDFLTKVFCEDNQSRNQVIEQSQSKSLVSIVLVIKRKENA